MSAGTTSLVANRRALRVGQEPLDVSGGTWRLRP